MFVPFGWTPIFRAITCCVPSTASDLDGSRRHVSALCLSEKDERIAKATRVRPVPTPEQIESVLQRSPVPTALERRNRAMIAFVWLTGMGR
jgi:hypothetical protein